MRRNPIRGGRGAQLARAWPLVGITDSVYALRYPFQGSPENPPLYFEAGLDPMEDELECAP